MFIVLETYTDMLTSKKPPYIVISTTNSIKSSMVVKSFVKNLGIPTVATFYGCKEELECWKEINENEYFIYFIPPGDVIPEIVKSIVVHQETKTAAILYDTSFGKTFANFNIQIKHFIKRNPHGDYTRC